MTKLENYVVKAAESQAAAEAATTERERAFHHRAHAVWRRLIATAVNAEERAAVDTAAPAKPGRR